jgi:hypothetical protein
MLSGNTQLKKEPVKEETAWNCHHIEATNSVSASVDRKREK